MQTFHDKVIAWTRIFRTKKLANIAKKVAKLGITANQVTFLSLIAGVTSIYFLYNQYWYFVIFGLLHLFLDSIDGVLARATKPTTKGKYFDLGIDNTIALLILIKTGIFLKTPLIFLIAVMFTITIIIHLISKLQAPVIFIRTGILFGIMLASHPLFPYLENVLIIGYYIVALISIYIFIKQIYWYFEQKK
tara:strand:- start:31903 stop:32475 length:573 start_codon:yes stop_codon:yes gene_type:complete